MNVRASLQFIAKDEKNKFEKPYTLEYATTDGVPASNFELETVDNIIIHDVRPIKNKLSLDHEGFTFVDFESQMAYEDYFHEEKLRSLFAQELRACLKKLLGASKIFFHECLVRKRAPDFPASAAPSGYGQPVPYAHGDYTPEMVKKIIKQICGEEEGARIIARHFQAINIWKPIKGPVRDWPLAFCDASSVDIHEDLVPSDDVHITDVIESIQVRYNLNQKWCYLHEQLDSEMLIFKTVDSEKAGTGTKAF